METFILISVFFQLFGIICSLIAYYKGYNLYGWYIFGLLFGPFSLIFVLTIKRKNEVIYYREI
jgi:hypothetical protein